MKKKRNGKKAIPQKGDPDYLTPTQLRNRRKRRAKQQKKQQQDKNGDLTLNNAVAADGKSNGDKAHNKNISTSKKDPSMKYISDPTKAPIAQAAKKYFKPILQSCTTNMFHVHLGPLYKWRTVSKLAVRPDASSKVAIGLFLPQSHDLLPVPKCLAHHPSINRAVECITNACHDVGVIPYQENGEAKAKKDDSSDDASEEVVSDTKSGIETGTGQLKYCAVNVARETGAVQITLVWNTSPPQNLENESKKEEGKGSKRKHEESIDDPVLEKLVTKLLSMSNDSKNSPTNEGDKDRRDAANTSTSNPIDEKPAPKKRRRGRREGKSNANASLNPDTQTDHSSVNNNTNIDNNKSAQTTSKSKQTKSPNLNLHSLWINYNPSWKHSNAIFSFDASSWRHVHGPPTMIEHLDFGKAREQMAANNKKGGPLLANPTPPGYPIPLNFPPNVFRQANIDAFTNIIGRIRERIQKLASNNDDIACVELYGGVGTIGLHLSDIVSSLVSSDENPNNSKCFYESVRKLPAQTQHRLVYKQKNAADMVASEHSLFEKSQVLIVDPPRKGLDVEVVDYLCKEAYKTMKLVVYVSCGFQAFQRDCDALIKSGRWKVEFAEGYLLFPGSDAIETLAFFVHT
mmetsp:Transcript_27025/g.46090  ORF Transcript_27025/g.46090 Transcript_27025/m.46090 type:complete len:628 (-) Transcript_27025:116-1999(-)|eukprot:CAMPEP_0183762512 /NCGR_PEP_ID=MMETSP0739-20130205/9120_1 /TAXON_ID=385413 /ORGANISM="Thalassiosira miniscula, Strain CCMP1093" /LENGTH=627 /DNA_ID=CAMNT_0026000801 /DNA_START=81 /DNA_END=1964 /DNA_ORIENTATION=-